MRERKRQNERERKGESERERTREASVRGAAARATRGSEQKRRKRAREAEARRGVHESASRKRGEECLSLETEARRGVSCTRETSASAASACVLLRHDIYMQRHLQYREEAKERDKCYQEAYLYDR